MRGVATDGTGAGVFAGFPIKVGGQDRVRPGRGQGRHLVVRVLRADDDPQYAVVMMVSQGGTGSGTSGPGVRAIYEALYGVSGNNGRPHQGASCRTASRPRSCRRSPPTAS